MNLKTVVVNCCLVIFFTLFLIACSVRPPSSEAKPRENLSSLHDLNGCGFHGKCRAPGGVGSDVISIKFKKNDSNQDLERQAELLRKKQEKLTLEVMEKREEINGL